MRAAPFSSSFATRYGSEPSAPAKHVFRVHIMDDPDVYYIAGLPSEMHAGDVVRIAAAALFLTFLATIYPALKAAKTQPAEALRYE